MAFNSFRLERDVGERQIEWRERSTSHKQKNIIKLIST